MTLKSSRHGGDVFSLAPAERNKILDFSININPLGLSPQGRRALERYWEIETLRYPDVEDRDVTEALAKAYHMPKDTIALGNGATELMYTLLAMIRPSKVLVPAPAFSEYRLSAEAAGIPTESFLLDRDHDFALPLEELENRMTENSLIYLGHPNNPDGCLLRKDDFLSLLSMAEEKKSLLVIDESFIDFVEGDVSCRPYVNNNSHAVVVMSLTKFYAVPGLRIGCSFAAPPLTEKLKSRLIPWNVNGPAQLYMTYAAGDREFIEKSRTFCREERARFVKALSEIEGLQVYPGCVNFILLKLTGSIRNAADLQKLLLPENIFIRQCGNYEGLDDSYFRLAVRTREENDRLIHSLKEVYHP